MAIKTAAVDTVSRNGSFGATSTITGVQFGAAFPGRVIVVPLGVSGASDITSLTIGGVAANIVGTGGAGSGYVAAALVPTGTSGDIVCTMSASDSVTSVGAFALAGAKDATIFDHSDQGGTSGNVTIPAGGSAIAWSFAFTDGSWTGGTQNVETADVLTSASFDNTGASGSHTFTYSTGIILSCASFSPASPIVVSHIQAEVGFEVAVGISKTIGPFTPPDNSLLVLCFDYIGFSDIGASLTSTGLTWTRRAQAVSSASQISEIWTCPIVTGASMSVTIAQTTGGGVFNGDGTASAYELFSVVGHDATTPIGLTGTDAQATSHSGVDNISLGGTVASGSIVVVTMGADGDHGDPAASIASGYISLANGQAANSGWFRYQTAYRPAGGVTTGDIGSFVTAYGFGACAIEIKAAVAGITLSPATKALALTGQTPSLKTAFLYSPSPKALLLTGATPTVSINSGSTNTTLSPAAKALLLTGQTPTLSILLNPNLQPVAKALLLSGQTPTLSILLNPNLQPAAKALLLTGQTPTISILLNPNIQPAAKALLLTGQTPTLSISANVSLSPAAAALVLTGATPTASLGNSIALQPAAKALLLTGQTPTVIATSNVALNPSAVALILSGQTPTLSILLNPVLQPAAKALLLTGQTPVLATAFQYQPSAAALLLAGQTPTVIATNNLNLQPAAAALILSGGTPTANLGNSISLQPAAKALLLVGQTPTISISVNVSLTPAPAALVLSGQTPSVFASNNLALAPAKATLILSGQTPTVQAGAGIGLAPAAASLVLTGATPTVAISGNISLAPPAAAITLFGQTPRAQFAFVISPAACAISLVGSNPRVVQDSPRFPLAASLLLTGRTPTITQTTAAALQIPNATIILSGSLPKISISSTRPPRTDRASRGASNYDYSERRHGAYAGGIRRNGGAIFRGNQSSPTLLFPEPPDGSLYLLGSDGEFLTGTDGEFLLGES